MKPLIVVVFAVLVIGAIMLLSYFSPEETPSSKSERESSRPPTIAEARTEAWSVLTDLANDVDEEVRAQTLEVIVGIDDPRAAKFLRKGMEDGEAVVRVRAAGLLAMRGRKDLVPFVKALADEEDDWDVFTEAAEAYGRIGTPDAIPRLVAILTGANDIDVDEDSQSRAALWLARLGAREAIPALRTMLDEDDDVAFPAAAALLALGETDVLEKLLAGVEDDESDIIAPALAIRGSNGVVDLLVNIVKSEDTFDDERGFAALSLATVATPKALEALGNLWNALPEMRTRENADLAELSAYMAAALAMTGDARGVDLLQKAAMDQDTDLAVPALEAVARLGRGIPLDVLAGLMKSPADRHTNTRDLARAWAARAVLRLEP